MRFYKKPPAFTAKINTRAFEALPYAVLIHSIIALFVYTSPDVYPNNTTGSTQYVAGQITTVNIGAAMTFGQRVLIFSHFCLVCNNTRPSFSDFNNSFHSIHWD